jgi:chromosome segregation ATPase
MDNLVHQSKDKQDYILKQYETNVEYMRSESHNELQAVKNKMEASVNDVNNNYNSLTVK